MTATWLQCLLYANLAAHALLLIAALWCIAFPSRRIYPMSGKTVSYYAMWLLFALVFLSNPVFVVADWDTGWWSSGLRFWLGVPIALTGAMLVTWGITTLGVKNTSALRDGFVARGPYLITRNPQYVGDILLFVGITILANSGVVAVTHLLTAFVFLLAPFAEEPWLEEQYGEAYTTYRSKVGRFV